MTIVIWYIRNIMDFQTAGFLSYLALPLILLCDTLPCLEGKVPTDFLVPLPMVGVAWALFGLWCIVTNVATFGFVDCPKLLNPFLQLGCGGGDFCIITT